MSWDNFVNSLFDQCVEVLIKGAHALGISYNEINIWIFCIIEPIVFFIMLIVIIWQWRRIRKPIPKSPKEDFENMLSLTLSEFFERDLNKLKEEITLYKNESDLWVVKSGISNSAGNLCLHLIGNLNHFIGATLGNTGYVRHRDAEFASKNISREKMIADIESTITVVKNALNKLSPEDFEKDFPLKKHDKIVSTEHMLIHLLAHFNYHIGQINYHRRIIA